MINNVEHSESFYTVLVALKQLTGFVDDKYVQVGSVPLWCINQQNVTAND